MYSRRRRASLHGSSDVWFACLCSDKKKRAAGIDGESGQYYYPIGSMTDLVYPVSGGMEDWAYGASFEASPDPISVCTPKAQEVSNLHSATSPYAPQNSLFSTFLLKSEQGQDVSTAAPHASHQHSEESQETPKRKPFEQGRPGKRGGEGSKTPTEGGGPRRLAEEAEEEGGQDALERSDRLEAEQEGMQRRSEETERVGSFPEEAVDLRGSAPRARGDDEEGGGVEVSGLKSDVGEKADESSERENERAVSAGSRRREGNTKQGARREEEEPKDEGQLTQFWNGRRLQTDEGEEDADKKKSMVVAYPASRSVYKPDDIRVALFLLEMHDQKAPSASVMGACRSSLSSFVARDLKRQAPCLSAWTGGDLELLRCCVCTVYFCSEEMACSFMEEEEEAERDGTPRTVARLQENFRAGSHTQPVRGVYQANASQVHRGPVPKTSVMSTRLHVHPRVRSVACADIRVCICLYHVSVTTAA